MIAIIIVEKGFFKTSRIKIGKRQSRAGENGGWMAISVRVGAPVWRIGDKT